MGKQLKDNLLDGPGTMSPTPQAPSARVGRSAPPPARGPPLTGRRFLSYDDLVARGIRYSRVHLRRLENAGDFPMHVKLGAGNDVQVMIAWVASEIESWEDAKIAKRDVLLQKKQTAAGAPAG
jgi:predicted DNA-binding transcriptional regulator AlpA